MRKILCLLILSLTTATAASAGSFSIFGTYWDTDALAETAGGGISFAFPLGEVVDLELRGTYYEELDDDALDAIFDDDDPVFEPDSIQIIPVDAGLRFNFARRGAFNPYISAGGTYFFLDSGRPNFELDDEIGYYGLVGSRFGDDQGAQFFLEAAYRRVEATVDRSDPDDTDVIDSVAIDLDGVMINAGVRFGW